MAHGQSNVSRTRSQIKKLGLPSETEVELSGLQDERAIRVVLAVACQIADERNADGIEKVTTETCVTAALEKIKSGYHHPAQGSMPDAQTLVRMLLHRVFVEDAAHPQESSIDRLGLSEETQTELLAMGNKVRVVLAVACNIADEIRTQIQTDLPPGMVKAAQDAITTEECITRALSEVKLGHRTGESDRLRSETTLVNALLRRAVPAAELEGRTGKSR